MPLNGINSVKILLRIELLDIDILIQHATILFLKIMSVAFISIAIFALMSIARGNKAADDTKKESVRQGKSINLFYCVFLPMPRVTATIVLFHIHIPFAIFISIELYFLNTLI